MREYFLRQIELWGIKTQKKLREKSVVIVGCGGLGSSIAAALSGVGLKKIYIVDFDRVSRTNIHRQIIFRLKDVGRYKSKVVAKYIRERDDQVKVEAVTKPFGAFLKKDIGKIDLIIDGTDNFQAREEIDGFAKSKKIPWIYGSVEEFSGQVCFFDKAKFDVFNVKEHKVRGVAAPFVMKIAATQANLAVMYLAKKEIKKDTLYFYSMKNGEENMQKFILPV